jgi:hypothetical protein
MQWNEWGEFENIAGNEVSIFLFRFELRGRGIDFVLNEEIAADVYPDVDEELKPLVHACCETLLRYQRLSVSDTIMDGNSGRFNQIGLRSRSILPTS